MKSGKNEKFMAVWKDIEPIIDEYERLFEEEEKKQEKEYNKDNNG